VQQRHAPAYITESTWPKEIRVNCEGLDLGQNALLARIRAALGRERGRWLATVRDERAMNQVND
jgi:hypothetical protein